MSRVKSFQSFLFAANVSSLQILLCMFLESISMLECFSNTFSTSFNHVTLGTPHGDLNFGQTSIEAFLVVVSR